MPIAARVGLVRPIASGYRALAGVLILLYVPADATRRRAVPAGGADPGDAMKKLLALLALPSLLLAGRELAK